MLAIFSLALSAAFAQDALMDPTPDTDAALVAAPSAATSADLVMTEPGHAPAASNTRATFGLRSLASAPIETSGLVPAVSGDFGIEFRNGNAVTMRITYLPNVPESWIAQGAEYGVGPVVAWDRYHTITGGLQIGYGLAAGMFWGPGPDGDNVIVPTLQTSMGPRFLIGPAEHKVAYIRPEICVVVTALAPCAGISVGGIMGL